MIPKIIHYCWFGSKKKPAFIEKYIKTWHKMLPDYQFMEWNEENCDLENEISYVKEAYAAKKFAFVSDYIRIKRLYEYGGVYFDTDVEVLRPFEECLNGNKVVLGLQTKGDILTAVMATEPKHPFFKECVDYYADRHFLKEDGTYDTVSINMSMSPFVEKYGADLNNDSIQHIENGIVLYPIDYFSAFDLDMWHPVVTDNTYTVHNMASSWRPLTVKAKIVIFKTMQKIIGIERSDKIKKNINK